MDSDGCQVRRRFYAKKTIQFNWWSILHFTINCTTQTVYKILSSGQICGCGEYLENKNGSDKSVTCQSRAGLWGEVKLNLEISVENVRDPEGERCTFSLPRLIFAPTNFEVRILPNVSTSVQPSPTTPEVLPSGSDGDNYDTSEPPTGTECWFLLYVCTVVERA